MPTSTDIQSVPASSAGDPGPGRDDGSIIEISRPATVTELVGDGRCHPCRRQGSRCHVEQGSASCLQCSVPEDCVFERLIVVKGRVPDFIWSDLIGQTSTIKRQPASTALSAQEPTNKPALPAIREILQQRLDGLTQTDNLLPSARQPSLWAPRDGPPSAGGHGSLKDSALGTVSEVSRRYVDIAAREQTPDLQLEVRVPRAAQTVLFGAAAGDGSTARRSPGRLTDLECSDCGYRARTRSDLKKHRARHNREHKCPFPTCPQKQKGFATSNDLDRHLFVVHKINNRRSRSYKCFGKDCTRPDKEWPRLDNFKSHLKKLHSGESETSLLQKSNDWYERQLGPRLEHDPHESHQATEAPAVPLSHSAEGRPGLIDGDKGNSAASAA